ncbi:MAG: hypothetical protein AB8B71_08535 [Paracoccaceae bacterium]
MSGLTVGAVQAQSRISAEAFLDIAVGKTLTFHSMRFGALVGTEEFLRRDLSVWKRAGGTCVYGRITIEAGQLCFLYDDEVQSEKSCWFVLQDGAQLYVRAPEMLNAEIQRVSSITTEKIECPNAPTS